MIDFLLGVPGKLKAIKDHLLTNWTATRAAKLDYLTGNAALASTALSNATWTNGRAALLDGIIQTSVIKSIQTGVSTSGAGTAGGSMGFYRNITVSSVTVAKCMVIVQQVVPESSGGHPISGYLSSSTNLQLESNANTTFMCRWYIVEFK